MGSRSWGAESRRALAWIGRACLLTLLAAACSEDSVVLGGSEADAVTGGDFDLNNGDGADLGSVAYDAQWPDASGDADAGGLDLSFDSGCPNGDCDGLDLGWDSAGWDDADGSVDGAQDATSTDDTADNDGADNDGVDDATAGDGIAGPDDATGAGDSTDGSGDDSDLGGGSSDGSGDAEGDGNAGGDGDGNASGDADGDSGEVKLPCTIDDDCKGLAAPSDGCKAALCIQLFCEWTDVPTGVPCDDGNPCTPKTACSQGKCSGALLNCGDNNPCTDDLCTSDGCSWQLNTAQCNDNSACTAGDQCQGGSCSGGVPLDCNDNSPCTIDSCNEKTGCAHQLLEGTGCNDDNPCTIGDSCKGEDCVAGKLKSCNDANPCTDDSCDATSGKCTYYLQVLFLFFRRFDF